MPNLHGQFEKMAHDITSGPGLSDTVEIAAVGGALGALVGYAKSRDQAGATLFAIWGAGLGIAGQYLLFHMLRPALRAHVARGDFEAAAGDYYTGAVNRGGYSGSSGGGGGMPYGPGPWPTQHRPQPQPFG
jgi:hypothetical protein